MLDKIRDDSEEMYEIDGQLIHSTNPPKKVRVVKCHHCATYHRKDSLTYFRLMGNLYVGVGGGLLGNANWDELGIPVYNFCVSNNCLSKTMKEFERYGDHSEE